MSNIAGQTTSKQFIYQMPAKLRIEDPLLCVGPLTLTLRQGFVLVTGACLIANLWHGIDLLPLWEELLFLFRLLVLLLLGLSTLIWSFLRLEDRYTEEWCIILCRYFSLPRHYRWWSCQQDGSHIPERNQHRRRKHAPEEDEDISL